MNDLSASGAFSHLESVRDEFGAHVGGAIE